MRRAGRAATVLALTAGGALVAYGALLLLAFLLTGPVHR